MRTRDNDPTGAWSSDDGSGGAPHFCQPHGPGKAKCITLTLYPTMNYSLTAANAAQ